MIQNLQKWMKCGKCDHGTKKCMNSVTSMEKPLEETPDDVE